MVNAPEVSFSFFYEEVDFKLNNEQKTQSWVEQTVINENKTLGEINYIFCSDPYLLEINKEHLNHDTFTDIVTFNYCEGNIISTDIFISVDRVKENALTFNTLFDNELHRVIIHGILHLVGYDDKSDSEKKIMRAKEDFYLTLL